MKKNNRKIGIVVVHFGTVNDTVECIESLNNADHKGLNLIVYIVDNDPRHRMQNNKVTSSIPIKRIVLAKNNGWGSGANVGTKKALEENCTHILWINNDVVVEKSFFIELRPFIDQADLVSPLITYYDKPDTIWCTDGALNEAFLFTTYPFMNKRLGDVLLPPVIESDYAGTCLFIKAKVFRKIGFVDERYFVNGEDVEWCFRAKKAGYRLIYVTKPLARHKVSASAGIRGTNILSSLSAYYYARNFFIILKDHQKSLNVITALIGQTFIRLPYYTIFQCRSFAAVISYFRGYFDGWIFLLTRRKDM